MEGRRRSEVFCKTHRLFYDCSGNHWFEYFRTDLDLCAAYPTSRKILSKDVALRETNVVPIAMHDGCAVRQLMPGSLDKLLKVCFGGLHIQSILAVYADFPIESATTHNNSH
jgi:hypothetical protein